MSCCWILGLRRTVEHTAVQRSGLDSHAALMIGAYLIIAAVFVIVGAFLCVVRRFLNESERQPPPPTTTRKPAEPSSTPPANRLSLSIVW